MKVKVTVTEMRAFEVEYLVDVDFQELLDAGGITRFEYNEDPEGAVSEYVEDEFERLIEEAGESELSEKREDGNDETEFVEAVKW